MLERKAHSARSHLFNDRDPKPLSLQDLVIVHATKFEPAIDESGTASIHTRSDTQGYPRSSLHFTLNHKVEGHLFGSWEDSGFTVVAPITKAIEENGLPANLYGIDTWWNMNPGQPVNLPGAIVISSAGAIDKLVELQGSKRLVKSQGFTHQDVQELFDKAKESGDVSAFMECLPETTETASQNAEQIGQRLDEIDVTCEHTTKVLAGLNQHLVISSTVEELGGHNFTGGMWATSREGAVRDLATDMGIYSGPHLGTPELKAEETGRNWVTGKSETTYSPNLLDVPIETRRVLTVSGVTAISGPPQIDRSNLDPLMLD